VYNVDIRYLYIVSLHILIHYGVYLAIYLYLKITEPKTIQ